MSEYIPFNTHFYISWFDSFGYQEQPSSGKPHYLSGDTGVGDCKAVTKSDIKTLITDQAVDM